MLKVALFRSKDERGQHVFPLFTPQESVFEKVAAPTILTEVAQYIENLRPDSQSQYVLVNAMGSGEFYGSNINGDYFPEASLIHTPQQWSGVPALDRTKSKGWPYGYPTFYNAHPFMHHRNKNPEKAYGSVELAAWNPRMHRVELVIKVDHCRCVEHGGISVWDKIQAGQFPDVSMGARVPFDTCFPAGTLVRTESGNKPIEQIEVGEKVLTGSGAYCSVTASMGRTANDLLRITVSGLPEIMPTGNHPFLVVRREEVRACKGTVNGRRCRHSPDKSDTRLCRRCGAELHFQMTWAAASEVRPGDYMVVPGLPPVQRTDIPLPRARMLGYYLGDGYIIKQRTGKKKDGEYQDMGVGFSVGSAEEEHLRRLLSTLAGAGLRNEPNVYDAGCDRKACIVSVYDQEAASWLQEMGGRGSRGKRLVEDVFSWPIEAKLELVGGYIDTDGSFDDKGQVRIASVNRGLLMDVQRLLLQERITATVCFGGTSSGYGGSRPYWYLVLSASQAQKFLGRSVKIEPREVSWESPQSFFWEGYWLTPVKSVEELDDEYEVYNLSVDELEQYVAEGRVVHNCSICLNEKLYHEALATFDPKRHAHPGKAVLEVHKKLKAQNGIGIRGLAITRKDYCEHALKEMNRIYLDGRKVWVVNDFPNFFDISFVFIGAEKCAKMMMKIAEAGRIFYTMSAELADSFGYVEDGEKVASVNPFDVIARDFEAYLSDSPADKIAKIKDAEMDKDIVPSQFASQAVPLLTEREPDLPKALVKIMSDLPMKESLGTTTSMGMVLKPKEFQRLILTGLGLGEEADRLEEEKVVFSKTDDVELMDVKPECFNRLLAGLLAPMMSDRSAFGPSIEKRVTVIIAGRKPETDPPSSPPSDLLHKISSAYNGYRRSLMDALPTMQPVVVDSSSGEMGKVASCSEGLLTHLSRAYFEEAFLDEIGEEKRAQATASAQRGSPSKKACAGNLLSHGDTK